MVSHWDFLFLGFGLLLRAQVGASFCHPTDPPFKLPSRPDLCGPPGVGGVECGLYEKPNPCLVTHEWREITVWCRVLAEAQFADYHPTHRIPISSVGGLGNRKEDWQLLGAQLWDVDAEVHFPET